MDSILLNLKNNPGPPELVLFIARVARRKFVNRLTPFRLMRIPDFYLFARDLTLENHFFYFPSPQPIFIIAFLSAPWFEHLHGQPRVFFPTRHT